MEKKKILLLGATGMAGHMAYHYLSELNQYIITDVVFRTPLTKNSIVVDVTDKQAVCNMVREHHPDIILNCVGVLIKGANEHPDNAIYINAYFPHLIEMLADEVGAKLIHISTDCVFSGKKGNYTETDFRDADDIYGRSKALGEIDRTPHLTLRTSIIGPELKNNGEGLFHWFMNQTGRINGYSTAIWGGITTLELAKAIDFAINNNISGIVQLSNGEGISKFDLLHLLKEIWNRNVEIIPYDANNTDKSISKSALINYTVPSYQTMLEELAEWMKSHNDLYHQYN